MSSRSLVFACVLAGCSAARYHVIPDPTLKERIVCGTVKDGAHTQVRAFSRSELRRQSLSAERATIEGHRILLDVVDLAATADAKGDYCLRLPVGDEYAFSFRGGERWATVVWSDPLGGRLDVELR